MKRKLGIVCNCIRGEDPVETLEKIKAAGFDCFFSGTAAVDKIAALKKRGDELGLEYEFVHAPFSGINNMWLPGMDYLPIYNGIKASIDAAAENGIPMIIMHISSGWKAPEINDLGLARFDSLVVYAKERGVKVAFENLRKVGNVSYFVDRYEHMDVIRHHMPFNYLYAFIFTESFHYFDQILSVLVIYDLPSVFWREDYVVFAHPFRMCKAIAFVCHRLSFLL